MTTQRAIPDHRDSSRLLSKGATLDHYKRELLASQYREAVLARRIAAANTYLESMGIRINPNPWDAIALTMDGLPVAPGV
jgi:hypothetical protein